MSDEDVKAAEDDLQDAKTADAQEKADEKTEDAEEAQRAADEEAAK